MRTNDGLSLDLLISAHCTLSGRIVCEMVKELEDPTLLVEHPGLAQPKMGA